MIVEWQWQPSGAYDPEAWRRLMLRAARLAQLRVIFGLNIIDGGRP